MRVTIEYFGSARESAGVAREVLQVEAPTSAKRLVTDLAIARGGRLMTLLLTSDGQLSGSVLIAVGDRQLTAQQDVQLSEGDEILVIPPVSGG